VFTQRRWAEEHATYRAASETGESLSFRERIWRKSERNLKRRSILKEVRAMSPSDFEKLIADIFSSQGMVAHAVGGTADDGVDVRIHDRDGNLWAIAQCKRYASKNKISAFQIREFAGAFMLSKAQTGFFFTTSSFTKHAKKTARGFPWLTIYNGQSFVRYVEELKFQFDAQLR
jgi:restriction endonuclease Mrr